MSDKNRVTAQTKSEILAWLRSRGAQPGETVEFGWLMLRVCGTPSALDVETLDMQAMASFTSDMSRALQVTRQQMNLLEEAGADPERCTQQHAGIVSRGYTPGQKQTFLTRLGPAQQSNSCWFIGSVAEGLTRDSVKNARLVSLYEISLSDPRLLPFWLLPPGYTVVLHSDSYELLPPGTDVDFIEDFKGDGDGKSHSDGKRDSGGKREKDERKRDKPWWKFW